jgi:hypothetical protein
MLCYAITITITITIIIIKHQGPRAQQAGCHLLWGCGDGEGNGR